MTEREREREDASHADNGVGTLDAGGSAAEAVVITPVPWHEAWHLSDVFLIAAASVTVMLVGIAGLVVLKANPLMLALGSSALEAGALLGSVYVLGIRRRGLSWQAVGVRPITGSWRPTAVALGVACIILEGLVSGIAGALLHLPQQNPQVPFLAPSGLTPVGAVTMFLLVCLVVPFAEEVFFRGILFTWLRGHWGFKASAIVSAVIFGAAHGYPALAVGIAVVGYILAWSYERSRSIWVSYTIHAVNNGIALTILYIVIATGALPPGK